jgi:hypothetical protein
MHSASRFKVASFALGLLATLTPLLHAQETGAPTGPAVRLPPFIVQAESGPPWRYTGQPGFEILSRWSNARTRELALKLIAAKQLFEAVLPPDLQAQFAVPTTLILVPDEMIDALPGPIRTQVLARAAAMGGRATDVRFLPNLMLWDRDELATFVLQPARSIEATRLFFSNDRVRLVLERRVPALPRWFIDGFCDLYRGIDFSDNIVCTDKASWIPAERISALEADPEAPRELIPLAELFANPTTGDPGETQERAGLRRAEAELFIRWALDGTGYPRRAALWRLVADASAGPVTERRFEELFGEDYFSALNDLSDYLPWALAHIQEVTSFLAPADSEIKLRDATPAEVGRIRGDWERLEMDLVSVQFPEIAPKYRERAQRTFDVAYQEDKTDPGLLAAMGLFNIDCGKPDLADPLLRAAAAAHVVRPRVYYELVRLLFTELIKAQPGATQARLSPIQAAALLGLLDQARAQAPPLPEVYGLYFQVALSTATRPAPAVMQVCREGVRLFPGDPALLFDAAVMLGRGGDLASATDILKRGFALQPEPQLQTRMAGFQRILEAALRTQGDAPAGP